MTAFFDSQSKMDVLDIIISVLRDHEKNLSTLADKFDEIMNFYERVLDEKARALITDSNLPLDHHDLIYAKKSSTVIKCNDFNNFIKNSEGSLLVLYEIDDKIIHLYSISDLFIFHCSEKISVLKKLKILNLPKKNKLFYDGKNFEYDFKKLDMIKLQLSRLLRISLDKIVEGNIIF